MELLFSKKGNLSAETAMAILRDHGRDNESWRPDKGITGADVCMHASFGPVRSSQSVGSMVVYLHPENPICFFTGTSAPCTSVFKPIWMDSGLPDLGPEPNGTFDDETLFWRHETLHRAILCDYQSRIKEYDSDRDALEKQFVNTAFDIVDRPADVRLECSRQFFEQSVSMEVQWLERIDQTPIQNQPNRLFRMAWNGFNQQAKMKAFCG
jgi:dipeptidase